MKEKLQKTLSLLLVFCLALPVPLSAAEQRGKIVFGTLGVPGATITATQGEKKVTVLSDTDGSYVFPDLADGTWSVQVEMLGFAPVKQDVTPGATPVNLELKMLPLEEIHTEKAVPVVTGLPAGAGGAASANDAKPDAKQQTATKQTAAATKNGKNAASAAQQGTFQRANVNAAANAPGPDAAPAPPSDNAPSPAELSQRANDGYLVNGSSSNGASSQFALNPAIGNNRRGIRSLYNGNIGFTLGNSVLNARQFSLTGQDTAKPQTTQFQAIGGFGGPVRIPHLLRNGGNFNVNYQWIRNSNGTTRTDLLPTEAERNGDFSQVLNRNAQAVQILNPATGQPFDGNMIPATSISPQAKALLSLYPLPNFTGNSAYNHQVALVSQTHVDNMQARWGRAAGRKNNLTFNFGFSDNRGSNPSIFNFLDSNRGLGYQGTFGWRRTFTNRLFGTFSLAFSRQSNTSLSNFANKQNISGLAGITGNDQQPLYWGPPSLSFASSLTSGLNDGNSSTSHNQTINPSFQGTWNHGRHNLTFNTDYRWQQFNNLQQQNPRGTFSFTGATTGYDFASFLLGIPDAASIAFGNADKYLRSHGATATIGDDWRASPSLTLNGALYWQYGSPVTEKYGRLVNLDFAPGFGAAEPVRAFSPLGGLTGMTYPNSLVKPQKGEFAPRLGLAWRPISGSSMVIRASYGMYYDTFGSYQFFANQMDQQSPLSTSLSIQNTPAHPLTLANGFYEPPNIITNTFAVDPNFRSGYAQIWLASVQRDLPASLQMVATYTGTKGTRVPQAFLPNTYAPGGVNPCPSCPAGFTYVTSNGNSSREAGSMQIRRRLHNGFQAQVTYTYSKSIDDAPGLGSAGSAFGSPAQNWLDLSGERGPSNFDQRHNLQLQAQYTSGTGLRGGTLLGGWRGKLIKEWTILSNVTIGSGMPFTPLYSAIVPGTSISQIRPNYVGGDPYAGSGLSNLNLAAFAAPAAGQWGNAGRNSLYGPQQFTMNATMNRTIRISDRYNMDLQLNSNNPINRVVVSNWVSTISSTQFGHPGNYGGMRTLTARVNFRF
jgi:hypothetical protein